MKQLKKTLLVFIDYKDYLVSQRKFRNNVSSRFVCTLMFNPYPVARGPVLERNNWLHLFACNEFIIRGRDGTQDSL